MLSLWVISFITENVTLFPFPQGNRYIIELSRTKKRSILKMCKKIIQRDKFTNYEIKICWILLQFSYLDLKRASHSCNCIIIEISRLYWNCHTKEYFFKNKTYDQIIMLIRWNEISTIISYHTLIQWTE